MVTRVSKNQLLLSDWNWVSLVMLLFCSICGASEGINVHAKIDSMINCAAEGATIPLIVVVVYCQQSIMNASEYIGLFVMWKE